jgi:hypothetical protein
VPIVQPPRGKAWSLVLLLYLATLSVDAGRKVIGLPGATLGIVYFLVGAIYLFFLRRTRSRLDAAPDALPVCLVLLSLWCVIEAIIPRVPMSMAMLGWSSYVFFVPLLYVGAELMSDDRRAARTLRVAAVGGAVVGLGAVASALLGQSAPALLQPIVASAGVHSFDTENIYLAPSILATAEEAAEVLLIALFAWIALAHLPAGKLARTYGAAIGVLIATGLIAAERRADIVVAVAGVMALLVLRPARTTGTPVRPALWTAMLARVRLGPALILAAVGAIALVSFLGASKLVPFLTSASNGQDALTLMFSPDHPWALSGQGTGTSTQGASLVGATTFVGIDNGGYHADYVLDGRAFVIAEGGLTKTWLELGIVGVILYGGVFFAALAPAVCCWRRTDGVGRALTILSLALGIIFLKGHQSLDDPLIQPFFWLAAGGAWGRMRVPSPQWPQDAETSPAAVTSNDRLWPSVPRSDAG